MNIHSKIPHGLLRSGRARSPACPVLGLKGLGYVPIVGTCADLDGGDRSLAFFAAAAHPPRSESWHLSTGRLDVTTTLSVLKGIDDLSLVNGAPAQIRPSPELDPARAGRDRSISIWVDGHAPRRALVPAFGVTSAAAGFHVARRFGLQARGGKASRTAEGAGSSSGWAPAALAS